MAATWPNLTTHWVDRDSPLRVPKPPPAVRVSVGRTRALRTLAVKLRIGWLRPRAYAELCSPSGRRLLERGPNERLRRSLPGPPGWVPGFPGWGGSPACQILPAHGRPHATTIPIRCRTGTSSPNPTPASSLISASPGNRRLL